MAKRTKEKTSHQVQIAKPLPGIEAVHAPAKEPTLLAVSIVLFALWFVFLLVTALFG
jgi:hypothetical protein